jgi:hypothetical protein
MNYPACKRAFDSKVSDGRIIHRICLDDTKATCNRRVNCTACQLCGGNSEPIVTPSFMHRAKTYAEALVMWEKAGRPKRTQREVEHIYKKYCSRCPFGGDKTAICRACGCRVGKKGWTIVNKIKMATETCPKGMW